MGSGIFFSYGLRFVRVNIHKICLYMLRKKLNLDHQNY
jgi:hypothetical protein